MLHVFSCGSVIAKIFNCCHYFKRSAGIHISIHHALGSEWGYRSLKNIIILGDTVSINGNTWIKCHYSRQISNAMSIINSGPLSIWWLPLVKCMNSSKAETGTSCTFEQQDLQEACNGVTPPEQWHKDPYCLLSQHKALHCFQEIWISFEQLTSAP